MLTPLKTTLLAAMRALIAAGPCLLVSQALANTCESLAALHLANATITRAEVMPGGTFTPAIGKPLEHLPPFCRVAATLKPSADSNILIEIWMPLSGWNERLEGTGNGGFAGNLSYPALAEGLQHGYAVTNTDMGMATPPGETPSIFINRPERWADWGYRATHEMTVVAKQVVHAYYARDPRYAYFVGCSTGGEQALMEAQRYPDDYDGIIGGAAANNRTGVHVSILWNFAASEGMPALAPPLSIFTRWWNLITNPKMPPSYLAEPARSLLYQSVINACDVLDGVKDGVITDPQQCHFDPAVLQCKNEGQQNCLTAEQVQTARQIYAGPVNPRTGERLYPGLPRGSEFGWEGFDPKPGAAAIAPFSAVFQWVFGLDWNWKQFDFDHQNTDFTQKLAGVLNATNPDIDTFRAHGHKLLMYHGWSDWLVAPGESINYYNSVLARAPTAGGSKPAKANHASVAKDAIDPSIRLFLVPGMSHCTGGPGETGFDGVGALVNWVEHGTAPEKIIASRWPTPGSGEVTIQRPLCPYPQTAHYRGSGDTNQASSFVCADPQSAAK